MAYFLKKTKQKNRTYLAIYNSFYSHEKKGTAHKCFKSLGSIESAIKNGIDDPISFYQKEVDKLNQDLQFEKQRLISNISPIKFLGYFPLASILDSLNIKKFIDFYKLTTDFQFDLYDLLSSLIFARAVHPCSKRKTFHEVLPSLFHQCHLSYDQLLHGLAFFGNEYEKIVELFTQQVNQIYKIETNTTYFDCTNFYFEIDREDDFKKKGPSKENQTSPIVGLGLLLDKNQIPIGMKMYPGNESEKPILRSVIDDLKKQNNITGKTIHVADKGLNCSENIIKSLSNQDGYLFSKSVKMLPEREKTWVLLDNDYRKVTSTNGETHYLYKSCIDEFLYVYTDSTGKKKTIKIKEKSLVTYNPSLAKKKRQEILKLVEKAKVLKNSQAKKSEFGDSSKYINFESINDDGSSSKKKVKVSINEKAIQKDLELAGYNMLVTSELKMKDENMYDIYHNLWRIEESFKVMKSDLEARPVFLQKEESIKGHFLVCYLTVLLERIFQFHILNNRYGTQEIFNFIRNFKVVEMDDKYINASVMTDFIQYLSELTSLPLTHYFLTEAKIKKVLTHKF
ncbi:MAG: IS1634 family transposase [Candidatus Lactobacillus pullistercoris]|uniref:IS1634 family transposase n=1 Tax=Candidatus Lactobacillus pullistercoris TaxID=2838636 RepID=A0A9E2NU61_9LACO|nr:IS1634 family transposase [Candidatus Lactobacillus pullistercoris]